MKQITIYLKLEVTASNWRAQAFFNPSWWHTLNKNFVFTRDHYQYIVCVLTDINPSIDTIKRIVQIYHDRKVRAGKFAIVE